MDFTRRKLPPEAAAELLKMPVSSVQPYALLSTPVYVYMRLNQKFVSVKAPLDFFTPAELEKFATFGDFFFERFVDQVKPFLDAGRRVKAILSWNPEGRAQNVLPPSSFEVSDALLRVMATLWTPELTIEPFFATAFSEALCDPLEGDLLMRAREQDIAVFERAVVASGWAVFLGCHLGYGNLPYLRELRERSFRSELGGDFHGGRASNSAHPLLSLVKSTLAEAGSRKFGAERFMESEHPLARRIRSRMARVKAEFENGVKTRASIYGAGGFVDA